MLFATNGYSFRKFKVLSIIYRPLASTYILPPVSKPFKRVQSTTMSFPTLSVLIGTSFSSTANFTKSSRLFRWILAEALIVSFWAWGFSQIRRNSPLLAFCRLWIRFWLMRPYGREVGGGTAFLVPLLVSYALESLDVESPPFLVALFGSTANSYMPSAGVPYSPPPADL